ncbi:MAG: AI-2E family transporter [Gaiellaceae bacterium]
MPAGASKVQIPRWIQLVSLPLVLLLVWVVARAVGHVVFLFLVAAIIALLLNPFVRALGRAKIPRGLAVAVVYLGFAAAVGVALVALATVVVDRTRSASNRVDIYFTNQVGQPPQTHAERDLNRVQHWLNTHHLKRIQIEKQGKNFLHNIGTKDVTKYTSKAISWAEAAGLVAFQVVFGGILVIVVSIYMLLDMPRLGRVLDRRFPPHDGGSPLLERMEAALFSYVKGQVLLSFIIGASAALGLYILGATGLVPGIDNYVLLFAAWVAFTELIPYLGPWLGAVPPVIYALFVHPISAIWVALLFLGIHQIEGHVVVPKVMGNALRLNPLLVIFGLLAGLEIYGFLGVLVVLPLFAILRAMWEYFSAAVELEPWGSGPVPVDVELEQAEPAGHGP